MNSYSLCIQEGASIHYTTSNYYIECTSCSRTYIGLKTEKELRKTLYKIYKDFRFNREEAVKALRDSVFWVYNYRGESYITPVSEDLLYKLLDSSYKAKEFTITKQFHTKHSDYKWRDPHYRDKLRLYSKLSTCGYHYRGICRDSGKVDKYLWVGYIGSSNKRSTGWKNSKKQHQWG